MKKIITNLNSRIEKRYVIKDIDQYLSILKQQGFREEKYSDNRVTQTIYFNVPNDSLPYDVSLKARRYLPIKPQSVVLEPEDMYFLEIKKSILTDENTRREKIRYEGTLKEILNYLRQMYHADIQPVLVILYERSHFVPINGDEVRITIDPSVEFFIFRDQGSLVATHYDKEPHCTRVEVKSKRVLSVHELFPPGFNYLPVISKGLSGFNFLCNYYEQTYGKKPFHKEMPGIELEAKLITSESDQIFNRIKKLFDSGVGDFKTDDMYPWIHNSASINRYYEHQGNVFRAALCDSRVKLTDKDAGVFIENPYGLHCLLKRIETKGKWRSVWDTPELELPMLSEFLRIRRAFWPSNQKTGRFYHITYDVCHGSDGNNLRQIEIEYVGKMGPHTIEDETSIEISIIEDICCITSTILERFANVQQSTERKQLFFLPT
jgi:hypothetical protein